VGITITSTNVRDTLRAIPDTDRRLERHRAAKAAGQLWSGGNVDAWFLDGLLDRVAPQLPKGIFSQGAGESPGPGDLTPAECRELPLGLQAATASDVLACYAAPDGHDPEFDAELAATLAAPGAVAGLDLAATIATLALGAANDGGLAVY
jgi:hypothetical protein